MIKIENVVVIGMGALGLLFGDRMYAALGDDHFCFLMDEERAKKHSGETYTINGEIRKYPIATVADNRPVPDLIVVATKYSGLYEARDLAEKVAGPETIFISVLNGISSEDILAERLPRERIFDCVAIGMDAMRDGSNLKYQNMGRLQLGANSTDAATAAPGSVAPDTLIEFFERANVPYELVPDIRKSMWVKFMMNVGINQACMVHECTYADALEESRGAGSPYEDLYGAMHEVMAVGNAEGVNITEEDYETGIRIFHTLNPDGYPSMSQDAVAKRKSEVDLFGGTVIKIAEKHGIEVPVNKKFYEIIKEKESHY